MPANMLYTPLIILQIKSLRPDDYSGTDNIELFNAIERAFEWEKCLNPFIEVVSVFGSKSYKHTCRELISKPQIEIATLEVHVIQGEWPSIHKNIKDKPSNSEINLGRMVCKLTGSDIGGNMYQRPFYIDVQEGQKQLNAARKDISFILSNNTILEIENIKPKSIIQLYLFTPNPDK